MMETGREGWTEEERELYDTRADAEDWGHARCILIPMVAIAREVGNDALVGVMEKAMAEVEVEVSRTQDALREN